MDSNLAAKIMPELSPIEAEYISAIEWLVFDDDIRVLAVGTSCGYLMIFSIQGRLIHRQIVNPAKVLKIRVRDIKQDLTHDTSSEEVCIAMPGVVGRFNGSDIKSLLQQWFQESNSRLWDQDSNAFQDNSGNPVRSLAFLTNYGTLATDFIGSQVSATIVQSPLEMMLSYQHLASPLTCLKDHPRKGEKLTLSPSGSLAAIT
ncbi:hypothetical protein SASPL_145055 [Salvia splendens]|uniref:Rab3-GAP regulatory subunit N-terminal domain-containing protein n=1 Tax=Salvia splendens TaxID=180675 RepID=A0A8X8WFW8_SALSN|nr:hypothetical protein SASPL_145055 [Salvia splendens]